MGGVTEDKGQALALRLLQKAFGRLDFHITFLQHSENMTFRVESEIWDAPRLLRLHVPVVPEFGAHGANKTMIMAELDWLRALQAETALEVPLPYSGRDGEWVMTLQDARWGQVHATLLSWMPGEHTRLPLSEREAVIRLGHLVGRLHAHGRKWLAARSPTRPRWDMARFWQAWRALDGMVMDGRLSRRDVRLLGNALAFLEEKLSAYQQETLWGFLHGDLYWGNVLWHEKRPALIDFSMCGAGFLLFDLAVCLADMPQACHVLFLQAYREHMPLPEDYLPLLEGFYIASAIFALSIWVNHAPSQEALIARVPEVARYAEDFLAEAHFWPHGDIETD